MLNLLFSTKGVVFETDIPPKNPQKEIHQTSFFECFFKVLDKLSYFPAVHEQHC